MVFYFTCSDPRYVIYMGRDKYENEHLIAHGWPEDLWFHVHNHSSAHVYLRLPKGETVEDVPEDIVAECSQLCKANSIEGCKLSHVPIVYTPWANLRKAAGMADGQVGFHDRKAVRMTVVEHRINAVVNRLNKTKVEMHNNPSELADLRRKRDADEAAAIKAEATAQRQEKKKAEALAKAEQIAIESQAVETVLGLQSREEAARLAMQTVSVAEIKEMQEERSAPSSEGKKRGGGVGRSVDVADILGLHGGADYGEAWDDDDDLFADGKDPWAALDDCSFGLGPGFGASVSRRGGGAGKLGALGMEAEAVAAGRKTAFEMEKLTEVAHQRKAEAARRAEEAARLAAEKAAKEAAELEAKRAQLHGKAAEVTSAAEAGKAAAQAALAALDETARASACEANSAAQEEELMVLEAIFGDEGLTREEASTPPAFRLRVEGETSKGEPCALLLGVAYVPEYPSHLPPVIEILEGVAADERLFVLSSLHALFFKQASEATADEPPECIMNAWTEWIREEWMAAQ